MSISISRLIVFVLVLLVNVTAAHAQQTVLRTSVFSVSSATLNSTNHTLHSTLGQPVQGRLVSPDFVVGSGFWHQVQPAAGPLALPVAAADVVATDEDTPVAVNVLANDSDPAGGTLRIIALVSAAHGSALVSGAVITYTPQADFFGDDAFSYTIANSLGGTASATVSVTINPINDAPRFTSIPSTSAVAGTPFLYTVETTDVEDNPVAITAPVLPGWLTLQDNSDGTATLSGTPTEADVGDHTVRLSVSDGALVAEQAFTVTVASGGLAIPQLVAPEDGASVVPPVVRLEWNAVTGAITYDVQVDTDATFSSPAEAQGVTNTEVNVTGLSSNGTFFWRVRAVNASEAGPFSPAFRFMTATNVATEEEEAVPESYALHGNYPNPFNPTTTIAYALPQSSQVRLVVYDLFGREVARLVDAVQSAGRYEVVFEADNLASGRYFYRMEAGSWSQTKQLIVLK